MKLIEWIVSNSFCNLKSKKKLLEIFLKVHHFHITFFTPSSFCDHHIWWKIHYFHFLDKIWQKIVFPVQKKKNEHCHWIQHIPNSLRIKFYLYRIVWLLDTKFHATLIRLGFFKVVSGCGPVWPLPPFINQKN